jgi:hypothetical protein
MTRTARKKLISVVILLSTAHVLMAAEGGRDPHHVAVATGAAWHGRETSAYLGIDYAYTFSNGCAAAIFVEQLRGDFDLAAYGLAFGKFFDSGWKLSTGPGAETKLKSNRPCSCGTSTSVTTGTSATGRFGPSPAMILSRTRAIPCTWV